MPVRLETKTKTGTIADAISEGFNELQSLRDEMEEWRSNMEEKLSNTEKYATVEACAQSLDEIADCESECTPETHADDSVSWAEQKKRSKKSPYPRWLRAQNATSALDSARAELESIIEAHEEESEAGTFDTELGDYEEVVGNLRECIDKLEEVIETANGLEFPGMFG